MFVYLKIIFRNLQSCKAISLEIVKSEYIKLRKINPSIYIGTGKSNQYKQFIKGNKIDVVVDASLSPIQQRNLRKNPSM